MFRRVVACLLVCCFLFCSIGSVCAKATGVAGGVITYAAGTAVGVNPLIVVGALLIALEIVVITSDDFWDLVADIVDALPDNFFTSTKTISGDAVTFLEAWLYDNKYYVSEDLITAVSDSLFDGTETYDETTGTVVTTAPVQTTHAVENTGYYDRALGYLFNNYRSSYDLAKSYDCCSVIHFPDGTWRYVWGDSFVYYGYVDESGVGWYVYPDNSVWVHVNADGTFELTTKKYGMSVSYLETLNLSYTSNRNVNVTNLATKSDYSYLTVIEGGGGSPDDGDDDLNAGTKANYGTVKIVEDYEKVEDMTRDEARSGEGSTPDYAVDLTTGDVIEQNGDSESWMGQDVGVDVETAVASILISLGISPGSSNADFRALVTDVIASLDDDMTFEYDSYTYGTGTLLKAWKYNNGYYFSETIMEHINNLLYKGSSTMNAVFSGTGFPVNESVFTKYDAVCTTLDSSSYYYRTYKNQATYLLAIALTGTSYSGVNEYYFFSDMPFIIDGYTFYAIGQWSGAKYKSSSSSVVDYGSSYDAKRQVLRASYMPPYYEVTYEVYEPGFSATLDVTLSEYSQSLSDLDFATIIVTVDGTDATYYPVKLFPTLEETEDATQSEIQTDYETSVPNISVDEDDGKIIEINRDTPSEVDPTTAPEVDPTTVPEVDPTTVPEVDPTTVPEVDPTTAPGVDPDTGGDTNTGGDTDTDGDTDIGGDTDTGGDVETETNTGTITETGLWGLLQRLGSFILNGMNKLLDLMSDWLLTGITNIIQWLADTVLAGIEAIFVPQEDFLSEKVQALRDKFILVDCVLETMNYLDASFFMFETSPPVIYIDLGAATGSYDFGEKVVFVDFSWYAVYKPTVDALIAAFLWIVFLWRVFVHLPDTVRGVGGHVPGTIVPASKETHMTITNSSRDIRK